MYGCRSANVYIFCHVQQPCVKHVAIYSNGSDVSYRHRRTNRFIVFARWRRRAPLSNAWFLGRTRVCQRNLDRFGRICTSHGLHRQREKPRYVATSSANVHKLHIQSWLGSRVVSVLDSGALQPGFKSQPRRCRVTVFGKLFTPIVPLFTKQRNW